MAQQAPLSDMFLLRRSLREGHPLSVVGLFDHNGIERNQRGSARSEDRVFGPYRVDLLMDRDINLRVVAPAGSRLHKKIRDVIEHRLGMRVDLALRSIPHAFRSTAVLAILEDKAVLPSWFKRHHLPPYSSRTLTTISCWWAEELVNGNENRRKQIIKTISGIDKLIVLSRNQVDVFASAGVPVSKIHPVLFGVDPGFYSPGTGTASRFQVLAAGVDRGRDFDSLLEAARLLPGVQFDLFTQPERFEGKNCPQNVNVHRPVDIVAHRDNLRAAQLVVVPTHDLAYPTGQSVLLEAYGCGRCTAVTGTESIQDYIEEDRTALVLPLGDPVGMAAVIQRALRDPQLRDEIGTNARRAAVERFSFDRMWDEITAETLA
jgi:glycosyltransferase involved in cell wall biosynthesis